MQGKRTRALDSRARPVPGIYTRDGRFIAGFKLDGRWTMRTLEAETLTEARRERESLLAGLREGRIAAPDRITFEEAFDEYLDSRSLSPDTRAHERQLFDTHLGTLASRRVQDVTPTEVARLLRDLRGRRSEWTASAVWRILGGTCALAVRRGLLTKNPCGGVGRAERPTQRNAKSIRRLESSEVARLVAAGGSERWRAAIALAGYGGLRLGEIRALKWSDVDLDADTINVARSLRRNGQEKATKTAAGQRAIPILPALRRSLVAWKVRSPHTRPIDYVICTVERAPIVSTSNACRALEAAKGRAKLPQADSERLSWHSLRHSAGSILVTELNLPITTVARILGHQDASFTLRCYARDARDEAAVVSDVLSRAAEARVGS